ncbi:MAG: hypothetical protein LKJ17_12125 [Oscillospiraceae bacterium]|jgi:hypothetical protein|nr:hypothetical protein [Oscillospiraceae bacterium]
MPTEPMYIDGMPLSDYGAKLLDWKPGAPVLTNTITPGNNYAFPRLLKSEITPKCLTATVDVIGADYADAMQKYSALVLAVNKTTELLMPDGYYYRSALSGVSEVDWPTPWIAEFTLVFQSVQHTALVSVDIPRSPFSLHYGGTAPAGYRIEFTAPDALPDFTICGITLNDIPNGAKVVIDGIEKAVTQNGTNKFSETGLTDFPVFDPQHPDTVISMSRFIPAAISYYPTYL